MTARSGRPLFVLGGLLVAVGLLSGTGVVRTRADVKPPRPASAPAQDNPIPPTEYIQPRMHTPPAQEMLRTKGINELIEHIRQLRGKQMELHRQEREAVSILAEKLKEQKEKLDKLGVKLEKFAQQQQQQNTGFVEPPPPMY